MFTVLVLLCDCRNKTEYESLVREWHGKKIIFPESLKQNKNSVSIFDLKRNKIVSYLDGNCPSCLYELIQWDSLKNDFDSIQLMNSIVFIIYTEDQKNLHYYIESNNICFSFFEDDSNAFYSTNKIPKNRLFHTFLLDEENKVKLIGNPLYNKRLMGIYRKELSIND